MGKLAVNGNNTPLWVEKQFKMSMCWQHAKKISPNKNPTENDLIELMQDAS